MFSELSDDELMTLLCLYDCVMGLQDEDIMLETRDGEVLISDWLDQRDSILIDLDNKLTDELEKRNLL